MLASSLRRQRIRQQRLIGINLILRLDDLHLTGKLEPPAA